MGDLLVKGLVMGDLLVKGLVSGRLTGQFKDLVS